MSKLGEILEILVDEDGIKFKTGQALAYQGSETCTDIRCTRNNGKCISYHCAKCDEPCSSQGHKC